MNPVPNSSYAVSVDREESSKEPEQAEKQVDQLATIHDYIQEFDHTFMVPSLASAESQAQRRRKRVAGCGPGGLRLFPLHIRTPIRSAYHQHTIFDSHEDTHEDTHDRLR